MCFWALQPNMTNPECVKMLVGYRFQYYTSSGLPGRKLDPNICSVCGNRIIVYEDEDEVVEKTYKLSCDHVYP